MNLKKGFSLLEVMVTIAIFSFLIVIFSQVLWQLRSSTVKVSGQAITHTRCLIAKTLIEKDLMCIFLPEYHPLDERQKEKAQAKKDDKKEENQNQKKEQKLPYKEKSFYLEGQKDQSFSLFTFMSTAALDAYKLYSPYALRILYTLEKDPENEGFFILFRRQAPLFLDIEKALQLKPTIVLDGILSCKVTLFAADKETVKKDKKKVDKDNKKEPEKQDGQKKSEYKNYYIWNIPEDVKKDEKKDEKDFERPLIPDFIVMDFEVKEQGSKLYSFECAAQLSYDSQIFIVPGIEQDKEEAAQDGQRSILDSIDMKLDDKLEKKLDDFSNQLLQKKGGR